MKANLLFPLALPTSGRCLYPDGCGLSYARRVFGLLGLLLLLNQTASWGQCFQNILDPTAYRLYPVGSKPYSLAKGDLNGDGNADLVTASIVDNTVSVLLGDGAGGFAPATGFAVGSNPYSVAIGDFNGDGKTDLVAANYYDNAVTVLLGTGTGSFGSPISFAVGNNPISVAVGDLNGDGKPDLVTANDGGGSVSVLLGNGAGGFAPATGFSVGNSPRSVVVADLNGDSNPDLVTANTGSDNVSVLLGDGAGGFGNRADFIVGSTPQSVTVGNLNGDGNADLVVANAGNTVSVLLGNGLGSFGVKTDFAVGGGPSSVAIGEFNGDGKPDLVTANVFDNTVSVLLGDGAGGFAKSTDFKVRGGPNSVVVGDFDGDSNADLATVLLDDNAVLVQRGDGAGHFAIKAIFEVPGGPYAVAVGDFNGDGKPDLATANLLNSTVSVLLATGTGSYATFTTPTSFRVGGSPNLTVGDVNGDGNADLVLPNANSTVSVLLGDGTGRFGNRADFAVARDPSSVAIGDFNGDGKPDLVTANSSNDNVSVLLGNGQGSFGNRADFAVGRNPYSVAIGDFNRDGNPDLVTANFTVSTVSVLLGDGAGGFGNKADFTVGLVPYSVAVADFNGDGKADLVAANSNSSTVSVLLGDGAGGFGNKADFAVNGSQRVAVGDFNGDSKLDLVTSDGVTKVTVLLGDGAGGFGNRADFAVGGPVSENYSVAVADFNGDGKADLVTANFYDNVADVSNNTVSVLYNCTDFPLLLATSASPNPVCAGASLALSTTVTGGSAPYSFTWAAPAGITLSSTSTSAVTASVGAGVSGVQTFTLTAAASGGTPRSTSLISVTVSAAPTNPSLNSGTLTCAQTSVTLTASATGGTSYTLNGAGGSQTNATGRFVVSSPGNYTAIIANANGCTAMATSRVVSNTAALTASLTNNGPLTCAQTSVTLTALGGTSYTFANGTGTLGTPGVTNRLVVTSAGTYSVTVSNASGCVSTATTSVVSATGTVSVSNPATSSGTLMAAFSQAFTASGGAAPYSYSIASGSLPAGLSLATTGVLSGTPTQSGSFTLTVLGRDASGCSGVSTPYRLTVSNATPTPTLIGLSASPGAVCAGSPVNFTASVGNVTGVYAYTLTNGLSSSLTGNASGPTFTQPLTASGTGGQSFTLTVTANGQSASSEIPLTVNPLPLASLTSNGPLTCAQTSVTLTASGGTAYSFTGPGGAGLPGSGNTRVVNGPGQYAVTVTNDNTGCSNTASTTVTSTTATVSVTSPAVTTATVGVPFSQAFTASGAVPPYSVSVVAGNLPASLSLSTTGLLSGTPTPPGTYSLLVQATDANGCTGAGTTYSLTVSPAPVTVSLRVLHREASNGQLSTNAIYPYFVLENTGSVPVSYSGLTVRYWLTVENPAPLTNLRVFGAGIGAGNVGMRYVGLDPARPGATGYVEYSFGSGAGSLSGNSNSGPVESGISKADYSAFNQADDYSYILNRDFTPNQRITAYVDGQIVWGQEPAAPGTTPPTPLQVTASATSPVIPTTANTTLIANAQGGSGSYTYQFSGPGTLTPNGNTAVVSGLPVGVQTFTVIASDATAPVSQTISTTVSVTVNASVPANTPPTTTVNANQTATAGMTFSFTANAFTDAETPNNLTFGASINPANGLTYNPVTRVLAGTPTATGVSSVTLTATDPGGLSTSTIFTVTVNPAPVAGVASLRVLHRDAGNGQLTTNAIYPYFSLDNRGTQPLDYSRITVRYWLTVENPAPVTNLPVYGAEIGAGNVLPVFLPLSPVRQNATGYVEYSFRSAAGSLAAGANSGGINTAISKQDYSAFDQANDYSYMANRDFIPNDHFTAYYDGTLVWGSEPTVSARLATAEVDEPLRVEVMGNPVQGGEMAVEITGAAGQPLRLRVTDLQGHLVTERTVELAGAMERQHLWVGQQAAGLLFLQVSTPTQRQTLKVLKAD